MDKKLRRDVISFGRALLRETHERETNYDFTTSESSVFFRQGDKGRLEGDLTTRIAQRAITALFSSGNLMYFEIVDGGKPRILSPSAEDIQTFGDVLALEQQEIARASGKLALDLITLNDEVNHHRSAEDIAIDHENTIEQIAAELDTKPLFIDEVIRRIDGDIF